MRMTWVVFGLAIAVAGCGSDKKVYSSEDATAIVEDGNQKVTVTDHESGKTAVISADVPEGFPKEFVYPSVIRHAGGAVSGDEFATLGSLTVDDKAKVLAHYKEVLAASGYKIDQTMTGGASTAVVGSRENQTVTISVETTDDGTEINIMLAKSSEPLQR